MGSDRRRIKLNLSVECHPAAGECQAIVDYRTPMEKVFDIDVLRQQIFDHFIKMSVLTRHDVLSARLVSKSWLSALTKQHFHSNQPFFYLVVDDKNCLQQVKKVRVGDREMLDHFTSTMQSSIGPIPPFRLAIGKDFFRAENRKCLSNFFQSEVCASGLYALDILVPAKGGTMTLIFPESVSFPALQKLNVMFRKDDLTPTPDASHVTRSKGSSTCFVLFVQFILNRAQGVRELTFNSGARGLVPLGIKYLQLPSSLTKLYLHCPLDDNQLQLLVANSFPNLEELTIQIIEAPMSEGLFFQILDRVKSTLRVLIILDRLDMYSVFPGDVRYLRFPVMERLENCEIYSFHVQLDTQNGPLQAYLPKLKSLFLRNQTLDSLQKWTENACLPQVTVVCMGWFHLYPTHSVAFSASNIEAVHRAFPNLKNFMFAGPDISREAVQYLFKEMIQLESLSIGLIAPHINNSDYWDCLLLGVPYTWVLRALERYDVVLKPSHFISIRNLNALRSLHLYSTHDPPHYLPASSWPLISELAVRHGFHKMPNLSKIELSGRFGLSTEMPALPTPTQ